MRSINKRRNLVQIYTILRTRSSQIGGRLEEREDEREASKGDEREEDGFEVRFLPGDLGRSHDRKWF